MSAPETTVLMAARDEQRYIGEAVASVLHQTYRDFEFLIIDDASTDGTLGVIEGFADPRIRIVHHTQALGQTRSLNEGLRLSRGRYIARMDGDDISHPARLKKQVAFLRSNSGCGLLGTGYRTIDEDGYPLDQGRLFPAGRELRDALKECNQLAHSSIMVTRQALETVGAYREFFRFAQDYDLYLRIGERYGVALLPEILLERRLRLDSVSIRHKVLQERFALLARACAERRRTRGGDPIAEWDGGGMRDEMVSSLGLFPKPHEERSLAAAGYFNGALYFKDHRQGYAHRTSYVIRLLKRSLLADPLAFFVLLAKHVHRFARRLLRTGARGTE